MVWNGMKIMAVAGALGAASLFAGVHQMENLGRGLIAANTGSGMLVSWRLLGTDSPAAEFNLYRDGAKIATVGAKDPTDFLDASGKTTSVYEVAPVADGAEGPRSPLVMTFDRTVTDGTSRKTFPYRTLTLDRPAQLTMPDKSTCTYTPGDMSAGDLDGDGEYELVVKWDPGNAQDNSKTGYTGNVYIDAYKLTGKKLWRIDLGKNIRAGAHYTQFMVYDLDGDGTAEVAMKTSDGTVDGTGKAIGAANADYRSADGLILSGKEYLTVFNGRTGAAMASIDYWPARNIQPMTKAGWGDTYGNRSERMLAAVAYLDGVHPSLIMCRGYYTYSYLAAYNFDGKAIKNVWRYSSPQGKELYGQGNHNISVGDIDADGYDEIVYGAAALNHDGSFRYSTGFGHGDALHLSDMDPDRAGLEVWDIHEDTGSKYSDEFRKADGTVYFGTLQTGSDNGRGLAADIDSTHRGFEMWSGHGSGVFDVKGNVISTKKPSVNFRIYWDGDLYDELFDGGTVTKWNGSGTDVLFAASAANSSSTINGTKSVPNISADLLGDYREEFVLYSTANPAQINIFTTPYTSPHRVYTLMSDPQYRVSVAWQNVAYNQPPHLGYFLPDHADTKLSALSISVPGGQVTPEMAPAPAISGAYWNSAREFVAPASGVLSLEVFRLNGDRIASLSMNVVRGANAVNLDRLHLGNGIYLVRSRLNGQFAGTVREMIAK